MSIKSILSSIKTSAATLLDRQGRKLAADQTATDVAAEAEKQRQARVLASLKKEYVDQKFNRGIALGNGDDAAPNAWINQRLAQKGERWRLP